MHIQVSISLLTSCNDLLQADITHELRQLVDDKSGTEKVT